jgi:hypothetical protein
MSNLLKVIRLESSDDGAIGALLWNERVFCWTLEPDSGDPEKPQTPAGSYSVRRFSGYKWKNTIEIIVPGHTAVLLHAGNIEAHSEMCVIIAGKPGYLIPKGKLRKVRAILGSRSVYKQFKREIVPLIGPDDRIEFIDFYYNVSHF